MMVKKKPMPLSQVLLIKLAVIRMASIDDISGRRSNRTGKNQRELDHDMAIPGLSRYGYTSQPFYQSMS